MKRYSYEGPVMSFTTCVANKWSGTTYAQSVEKAYGNLIYQYKQKNGKTANSKITLPGKLIISED